MASVGLFGLFLHAKGEGIVGNVAAKLGSYVLGVYLLHENIGVRYGWQKLFGAEQIGTVPELLVKTVVAVICVFVTGVIVEFIRSSVVKGLGKLLLKLKVWMKFTEWLDEVNQLFVVK